MIPFTKTHQSLKATMLENDQKTMDLKLDWVLFFLEVFGPKGFYKFKKLFEEPYQKFCQTKSKAKNQQQRFLSKLRTRQQWSCCRGPPCAWCSQKKAPSTSTLQGV
jgi:hypothetical protein